jgi:hypothetical protein
MADLRVLFMAVLFIALRPSRSIYGIRVLFIALRPSRSIYGLGILFIALRPSRSIYSFRVLFITLILEGLKAINRTAINRTRRSAIRYYFSSSGPETA